VSESLSSRLRSELEAGPDREVAARSLMWEYRHLIVAVMEAAEKEWPYVFEPADFPSDDERLGA
jgi:hypothetical protein